MHYSKTLYRIKLKSVCALRTAPFATTLWWIWLHLTTLKPHTAMLIGCQRLKGILWKKKRRCSRRRTFPGVRAAKNNTTESRWSIWGSAVKKKKKKRIRDGKKADLSLNGNSAADLLGLKKTAVSPATAAAANVQFTVTNAAFTI